MPIEYVPIDREIEEWIAAQYGAWVREYDCLQRGEGCFLIAAVDGERVAGFAAAHPERWIEPLTDCWDSFIEVLEVAEPYRRQGVASRLIALLEESARAGGARQIRAWSSTDKTEAIHLWRKLGYCMCPAAMLGESVVAEARGRQIPGYYVAKSL